MRNEEVLGDAIKDMSDSEKLELVLNLVNDLKRGKENSDLIPIGVFSYEGFSCLEAIVKYLHENCRLRFVRIGSILNRSSKTIWATYAKAKKKSKDEFSNLTYDITIPVSVFSNRKFSILESLVGFLRDEGFGNRDVGELIRRSDSTVWSSYRKYKEKKEA